VGANRVVLSPITALPVVVEVADGQIHLRYELETRTVDDGRCGADQNWKPFTGDLSEAEPGRLCGFCFPSGALLPRPDNG
jgi:hypothetical protein